MPARAVILVVSAAITVGIVAYHERERLRELFERTGRQVALSFSQFAEELNPRPRQTEYPMTGRAPYRPRTPDREQWTEEEKAFIFDEKPADTEERKRNEDTFGTASGWEGRDGVTRDVRHRGSPFSAPASDSVLFDATPASPARSPTPVGIAVKVPGSVTGTSVSRRSSSATLGGDKALPNLPPALPPKPQGVAAVGLVSSSEAAEVPVAIANADSSRTASSSGDSEEHESGNPFGNSQPYWSIHEWAENATRGSGSRSPSIAGSAAEEIPQPADEILSEFGSEDESVGSWTEIGSSIHSDDEN
ncbi:hypothetical protein L873DRAFT_697796 [Choiromyces venosus 120613-1]|uniref:Uncharacterized protein n=1 Tax=Choiromyces venosus 120613-1 TaxID=1336337 RepID=A0A3N4JSE8_9PEZI|nr:hypothetical protein L873DRAFT_697796 [Choiromyces venosus 120613-1]